MEKRKAMRWVKALRSGKYKQGAGTLMKTDTEGNKFYCCLGVVAIINKCDPIRVGRLQLLEYGMHEKCGLKNESGWIKDKSGKIIGLKICGQKYESITGANDNGVSFKRIATWIEKNYKLL